MGTWPATAWSHILCDGSSSCAVRPPKPWCPHLLETMALVPMDC